MTDLEFLYFEKLKEQIQAQYLKNHTPSFDELSKWKGIDIIYFQEDLRKIAKGNISEKSFYTYFKTTPTSKLPRIDMLNLLSIYVGFKSWSDFKKHQNIPLENANSEIEITENIINEKELSSSATEILSSEEKNIEISPVFDDKNQVLQNKTIDNQENKEYLEIPKPAPIKKSFTRKVKDYLWIAFTIIFGVCAALLGFKDYIFGKTYTYCFSDADRTSGVRSEIEIKVIKENESPLFYKIKPGECFYYPTKDKNLTMEISSPFYENLSITRSLENAPKEETIELKPDDYKFAFYFFSLKDISGNSEEVITQKRRELESRISNDAVIKQIYDSDIYGLETISKEKYITLVTTPTTSLKNLNLIEMKRNDSGKIISIKFKITSNEKN